MTSSIIGTARKAAGGPTEKCLGHMTKVPYTQPTRYRRELDIRRTCQIGHSTIAQGKRSSNPTTLIVRAPILQWPTVRRVRLRYTTALAKDAQVSLYFLS
jgi:hypothetical protein